MGLFLLHVVAFILHFVSYATVSSHNSDVFTNRDIWYPKFEYNSDNTTVSTSSTRVIVGEKQNYMTWITVNEFISAISHLVAIIYFLSLSDKYPDHPFEILRRTIEYTATGAILQIALVLGVGDILFQDVVFIFVINAAIQYIGYSLDRIQYLQSCGDESYHKSESWKLSGPLFQIAFGLLLSELVYVYILSTNIEFGPGPLEDQKGFLMFIGIMYVLFYISFLLLKYFGHYNRKKLQIEEEYWFYVEDSIYVVLSVTCKISLSWMLVGNVFNGFYNICDNTSNKSCDTVKEYNWYGNWNDFQIFLTIFGLVGIIASTYVAFRQIKQIKDREKRFQEQGW